VKIIGLTGGIASGKSTVAGWLRERGVVVLDADAVAHELLQRGQAVWRSVWEAFGWWTLLPDGRLDRVRLGRAVFSDAAERATLNRLTHPAVRAALRDRTRRGAGDGVDVVVWDVPLLIEGGLYREVDEVWVVYATAAQQLERLMRRSGMTPDDAARRLSAQRPLDDKRAYADVVLDNTRSPDELFAQVQAALRRVAP
jgi:dephospho-CoA kinase